MTNKERVNLILKSKLLMFLAKDRKYYEIDAFACNTLKELVKEPNEIMLTTVVLYARSLQQYIYMKNQFSHCLTGVKKTADYFCETKIDECESASAFDTANEK